jgi:NAD+ kinase
MSIKKVGIAFHPHNTRAPEVARRLAAVLDAQGIDHWQCSAWEESEVCPKLAGTDLILSVGGDGTILRLAHMVDGAPIPITGVNVGQLGFLTEIPADDNGEKLIALLTGKGWIDERAMLQAELQQTVNGKKEVHVFDALNDVVLTRGAIARIIEVTASVNGAKVDTYKADGALVASATGSTGYSLAAGGPILFPQSTHILLVPILPHLSLQYPLVLHATASVNLKLSTTHPATLSIDGHISVELCDGASVTVKASPKRTRFLRLDPPEHFYATLGLKLKGKYYANQD